VFAGISDFFASLHWPTRGETMFQSVLNFLSSAYVELAILILLLIYFFKQRRDPRVMASGIRLVRTIIIVMIFAYFTFIWASTVEPSLRNLSVFGMFLVNLIFAYHLILGRLQRPYQEALENLSQNPQQPDILREVWQTGKWFYYLRYALGSLFSGMNPLHFLSEIASDRVRDDIKDALRKMGVEKKLISMKLMVGFMKSRLAADENLPADFKSVMEKNIDDLGKHPWLEEQINEFLRIALENPEDLHFPEWMAAFEKYTNAPQ
jgi:Ca2+/Na+ antiporter